MSHLIGPTKLRKTLLTLILIIGIVVPLGFAAKGFEPWTVRAQEASQLMQTDFIRQIPLTANDVVYSSATGKLYASVPSNAGQGGNSITTIDPLTGTIGNSVFIGSEPNKLALSDNGTALYASLDGAYAIRRFDTSTETPGAQFAVGQDSFFGVYAVADLAVAPGNPDLLAVARSYRGVSPPEAGVAIFDNGVPRPTTGPGHTSGSDYLSFSASAAKLYGTGFYSGLTTLAINASGVSITSTSTLSSGWRVKFDNGLIYSGNGQVINPDTGALLGTFSGVTNSGSPVAFVPDSSVGRAYYLVAEQFGSQNRILKAYDTNTFLPVGSLSIPGVIGDATTMVRWGSNGLAFRTTGNQLFLIQTSLIPSADPIPTPTPTSSPTPTVTPTPAATFVRQIPLATNDFVYNDANQTIYASVPSSAGSSGNSIVPINPITATVGNSVFIGSEPNKLALSDDHQTLYATLSGAGAVRSFDIPSQTPGLQFTLGNDNFDGPRQAGEIAVMPGAPGSVAVGRSNSSGTLIYDSGTPRLQIASANGSMQFRSPSTLYIASGSVIQKFSVTPSGLSSVSSITTGSSGTILYDNGLVYMSGGAVVDPEAGTVKGTFSGGGFNSSMSVDSAHGRVYFLSTSSGVVLRAFDINTFLPLGSVTIQGISGSPGRLVRWGSNGLAFRTSGGQIVLIQTALVDPAIAVPAPTPTPSPVPSPSPPYIPTFVKRVDLTTNDLVYNQSTQAIYASVPSVAGANGNSITKIDPQTGAMGQSVSVGSEPNKLALADDGTTLHVSLDGAGAIRRVNASTMVAGPQFTWSNSGQHPYEMLAVPGRPNSVATSDGVAIGNGVAIYDDGVQRPNMSRGNAYSIDAIAFGADATRLYGTDNISSGFEFVQFAISASGVAPIVKTNNMVGGVSRLKFSNGLLYGSSGKVIDPEALKLMGTFQGSGFFGNSMVVDQTLGRVFFVSNAGNGVVISAYDINTFVPLGSVNIVTNASGSPTSLVRWGANGLAFRVPNSFGQVSSTNPASVYLIQSALVSSSGTIPTGVQFSSPSYNTFEGNGPVTITVSRSGDVSSSTSVDYATSDGTATAGSDYTATSGTLAFAAGELSKTVAVPIINDNVYEGDETFNLTLTNPTNGALLTSGTTVVTINDNDNKPMVLMSGTFRATEGNSGTKVFTIPINLSNPTVEQVSLNYTTENVSAAAGTDYVAASGTLIFPPGTTSNSVSITVNGDTVVEPDETFLFKISNFVNTGGFTPVSQLTATIANDDSSIQLSASSYSIAESGPTLFITATRIGDLSSAAAITYATSDVASSNNCNVINGAASARCDYSSALGTLKFAAGQTSAPITVPIIDDAYAEGNETFTIDLGNPSVGTLGSAPTALITITDNESVDGTNPIGQAGFFVRLHYIDFLNREPDASGLAFWTNQITECEQPGVTCNADVRRINVSAAFFLSIEFQETGYLVERIYKSAYGDAQGTSNIGTSHQLAVPVIRFNEFLPDTQQIGKGVIVGQTGWEQVLENNKVAFALDFVSRTRFTNAYPTTMTPAQFVDALYLNTGVTPPALERTAVIGEFGSAINTADTVSRRRALRRVAENTTLKQQETNKAFVLMQYYGYLRRNPNDQPDADYSGFDFWLTKLNQFNGNFVDAEMVKAFITSGEYRGRFGP
jgi:sugar lactone lactonase YvrE